MIRNLSPWVNRNDTDGNPPGSFLAGSQLNDPKANVDKFEREFSEESFWKKIVIYAKKVGREGISKSLTIYYCANDPDTPAWARSIIVAVLGYFILPADAIPDLTPIIGFSDDFALIATALAITAAHVKDEHKKRAEETLKQWF